jgi:hypothetical protein
MKFNSQIKVTTREESRTVTKIKISHDVFLTSIQIKVRTHQEGRYRHEGQDRHLNEEIDPQDQQVWMKRYDF